jgi:hypothetical protein
MDPNEVAARANELPERFRDRLPTADYETIDRQIGAGEWGEGIENLVAALHQTGTPITHEEQVELTELMEGIHMPTDRLRQLAVQ